MDVYKDARILGGVSWFVTFIVGVLGNIYIISTITTILKQRKNIPNTLILILSLTDLVCVLCTYVIPGIAYVAGRFIGGNVMCNIQTFTVVFVNMLSVLIVLGVVFERYYAVADPYAYQEHMEYNLKKILLFLVVCASLAAGISLPTVVKAGGSNDIQFPGTFCMINTGDISIFRIRINVIFYIVILSVFIFSNVFCNLLSVCTVRKMTSFRQQHATNQSSGRHTEEYLFMRLCVVTCVVVFVLWTPLLVYFILALGNISIPNWYTMLTYRLAALNCVINPWLYPLLRKRFRSALHWHLAIVSYYVTLTVLEPPLETLAEAVSNESSGRENRAVRPSKNNEDPYENVMINIAQRNIIDYVDAPPDQSKSHDSNSCDVSMQSASNEIVVDDKKTISQDDSAENFIKY